MKLLLVEDNAGLREQMKWALCDEYEVLEADGLEGAVSQVTSKLPPLVCLDLGLENKADRGLDILDAILSKSRQAKVVVVTSNLDTGLGREAVRRGAFDYLQKPVDIEVLKVILLRAARLQGLEQPEPAKAAAKAEEGPSLMVGESEPMRRIFGLIEKLAKTHVSVLITGESGTGKELCARALHLHSPRRERPFIPINCGAIPDSLLESELFGYVKGAFTGAAGDKVGLIEAADTGTLFLDEIGDMPMALQVKLLRFLQDQSLQRVGDTRTRKVDVRVVAATNKTDLGREGNDIMRTDLYYRLSEFEIHLPPLRDRGEDILLIARRLVEHNRVKFAQPRLKLSPRAEKMLLSYGWPGNVRELENKLSRATITCQAQVIEPEDLQLSETHFTSLSFKDALNLFERNYFLNALRQSKGNISLAAKNAGLTRPTFYERMRRHGISVQLEARLDDGEKRGEPSP